jgi:predicted enzyme related to lactoylglutathione lyase
MHPARMSLRLSAAVLDARDMRRAVSFWTAALGYEATVNDGWTSLSDPKGKGLDLGLQPNADPKHDVNRVHLDLTAVDVQAEVRRLEGLGAKRADWAHYPPGATYVVMLDPEGNEFCVVPA